MKRFIRRFFSAPIRFYRRYISRLKPPMCRFDPTCSTYAIEAIEKRGVFMGFALTTWRLCRCQPFCKGGHDPVPLTGFRRTVSQADEPDEESAAT